METKEILLYYTLEYEGNWDKIFTAIKEKEEPTNRNLIEKCKNFQGNYITILNEEYPVDLRRVFKPPFVLFYEGNIDLLKKENIVSVSCTRNPSAQDYYNAKQVLENNLDVAYLVSTLKNDMDKYVLSLKQPKIAVIGHGLNRKQPMEDYSKCDLIITELPPDTEPNQNTLGMRYRIIAGLLKKEILVNAPLQSGITILITHALDLGKEVRVLPSIDTGTLNFALMEEGASCCYKPEHLL